MAKLTRPELYVINQLLDHDVFTGTKTLEMGSLALAARDAYQRPEGQRRINGWFNQMFGHTPLSFQDNWLWLDGPSRLTTREVTVLLATLKAVINTPAVQGVEADRVIETRPVINTVLTATEGLNDREVYKIVNELFVERFQLLQPDNPIESDMPETSQVVDEYWDVAVDFVALAQLFVQALKASLNSAPSHPTGQQQVCAYLFKHRYLDPETGALWTTVQQQKVQIAALLAPLQRYYLEVGDDYAVLLDGNRRPLSARPYFVALAVAATLGTGLPQAELGQLIAQQAQKLYPAALINSSLVKTALIDNGLARLQDGAWHATPVSRRFAITLEDEHNGK